MNAHSVRVVVVDDAKDSAETMAELLRMSGYEVLISGNGTEALALVDKHAPQCVLFDVVMPNIGGDELCIRLRADHGDDIVLVAVTGCSEDDPRVRTSFALADHYFTKPVDPASLAKVFPPLA